MIDKLIYSFFGSIDKIFEKLNKIVDDVYTFDFPNCKNKKHERHKKINRVHKKLKSFLNNSNSFRHGLQIFGF